ncbi:hypothetical protein ABCS02_10055 [Microbacterium sp. X-17]|uniref:hypothetical protein n=1 Tax=Microbacterium sp. X-17 TaxID=3144404 RepID=UPI0031F5932F
MSINRKALFGAAAAVAAVGLAFGIAPAANANPAPGTNPIIDGFGSDTTQDVLNGLASVIKDGSGNAIIASYDATSAGTSVTPGEVAPTVTVPVANGSGQGKTVLAAAVNGTSVSLTNFGTTLTSSGPLSRDDAEFARSSSGGTWNAAGQYAYLPFGVDAVTYATAPSTAVPNGIPLGTVVGQDTDGDGTPDLTLKNIYGTAGSGVITLENASNVAYTVGAQGSGANIIPFIPQAGSGTRQFWAQATLGSSSATFPSRVSDTYGSTSVQEHDGSVLTSVTNAIVPFSVAQWIAQGRASTLSTNYGVTVTDRRHGAVLGNVGAVAPINALTGNLNPSFPINRAVFNVVEYNAITSGTAVYNSNLDGVFNGSSAKVLTAKRPGSTTVSVINDFGFGTIPAAGFTPLDGKLYVAGTVYRATA